MGNDRAPILGFGPATSGSSDSPLAATHLLVFGPTTSDYHSPLVAPPMPVFWPNTLGSGCSPLITTPTPVFGPATSGSRDSMDHHTQQFMQSQQPLDGPALSAMDRGSPQIGRRPQFSCDHQGAADSTTTVVQSGANHPSSSNLEHMKGTRDSSHTERFSQGKTFVHHEVSSTQESPRKEWKKI